MSKKIMYVEREYHCPICGKSISIVKVSKEYIRCFNKDKTTYELQYNCNCKDKINEIVNWSNTIKEDFSELNILNIFANATNKAFENALKDAGVIEEE